MDEQNLRTKLNAHKLSLSAACKEIHILTEGTSRITHRDVRKHLDVHGRMSNSMAVAFEMLFVVKDLMKERHGRAA